jgi:hypothetical protein
MERTRGCRVIVVCLGLMACTGPHRAELPEDDIGSSKAATVIIPSSVLTHHNDLGRSGVFSAETLLTPDNVRPSMFGERAYRSVSGEIYGQPLYVANVTINGVSKNAVYVVTMQNNVYAFDADSPSLDPNGATLLSRVPIAPPITKTTNPDVAAGGNFMAGTDTIGIMSTPVIDPATLTMYLVAGSQNGATWKWTLFALDITTLNEIAHVDVCADMSGHSWCAQPFNTVAFDPLHHVQRSALTLVNNRVIFGFAGVADQSAYHGWIFSYVATPSAWANTPPTVFSTTTTEANGAGIWQSGAGFVSDGANIYAMSGNCTNISDTSAHCSTKAGQGSAHCNAFFKLSPTLTNPVSWNPMDAFQLDCNDADLGSGGPVLLPDSANHVAGGGKTGVLFVHDQNLAAANVRWFQAAEQGVVSPSPQRACPPTTIPPSNLPTTYDPPTDPPPNWVATPPPNIHGNPIAWSSSSYRRLYVWAEKDVLRGYNYDSTGNFNQPACDPGATPNVQGSVRANPGMPGAALSLSSNGSAANTGIVWATIPEPDRNRCNQPDGGDSWCNANQFLVNGRIYAFDATNLTLLWDAYLPSFAKFTPPTIAGGKVFVPTFSNKLLIFGRLQNTYTPVWTPLSGTAAPAAIPAITSWNISNRMDVFVRGSDNTLLHKAWNSGAWTPAGQWEPRSGILTSNPIATNFGTSQIDVIVRNTNQDLSDERFAGVWQNWAFVPGNGFLTSDPVAVSWGSGRIDLFALGSDSQLKHLRMENNVWQPWESVPNLPNGQPLTLKAGTRPAVVSWSANRIDVAVRGADNALYHIACTGTCSGTQWSAWDSLSGILTSDPAMASWGPNRLDVFVQGLDQQLKHIWYTGSSWSSWEGCPVGSSPTWCAPTAFDGFTLVPGSVPSVVSPGPGQLDLYVRSYGVGDDGAHNLLSHISYDGSEWSWWEPLANGILVAGPAAMHAGGQDQIVVIGLGNSTWATTRPSGVLP